ncbi:MAG: hypothetical protein MUC79_08595 [Thiobacillaceae bacterium]|jgi:hypothetical protein|nr:hypothetical protein [Thiobacillaceae bacterium]
MAIGWLTVLKVVPWTEVITNAPRIADGAVKLWRAVAKGPRQADPPATAGRSPRPPGGASLAELEGRLAAAEASVAELRGLMLASAEIIKDLTEQNTRLIERIEANRARTVWLALAVAVAALVAGVALAIALGRPGG